MPPKAQKSQLFALAAAKVRSPTRACWAEDEEWPVALDGIRSRGWSCIS
jgi:hypothetical protein